MATSTTLILLGNDGIRVNISREAAKMSGVLRDMMEDLPEEQTYVPVPIDAADGETLETIARWCEDTTLKMKNGKQLEEERLKKEEEERAEEEKRAKEEEEKWKAEGEAEDEEEDEEEDEAESEASHDDYGAWTAEEQNHINESYEEVVSEEIEVPKQIFFDHDDDDDDAYGAFCSWEMFHPLDPDSLFKAIVGANFLDISLLVRSLSEYIAYQVTNMSTEEMRDYFGIENDFTPEEEEELRKEHAWAEKHEEDDDY
ncbi:Skp1 family, dimerization domain-containing protein [Rostrohypoxylon terebratum]|nr:Skp1 family, dimerization domain-containing protein [Rostrohypoxylon terebratum]